MKRTVNIYDSDNEESNKMAQILFDCITTNDINKFKTTMEIIDKNKENKYDLNYILNTWVNDAQNEMLETPLIVHAVGMNLWEIVETIIDHKVCDIYCLYTIKMTLTNYNTIAKDK